jgi:hypothetical protein
MTRQPAGDRLARHRDPPTNQRQRGRYLGGKPPFGWRVGEDGELVAVPEQQRALKRMREMRAKGLALQVIADKMNPRVCRSAMWA